MKKLSILALAMMVLPIGAFAASKIKDYKAWDNMANIQLEDGLVKVYKIEDPDNAAVKCYVATQSYSMYQTSKGAVLGISCVK